ncbi:O-antigen ligase family protein [Amedibacillus dolichus]|uniref:O-antigen ligase family protein n=1 Tax=Amedibacillus dolichus TaxID=31971 RepID=UPI001D00334C|nr:O-antigen ligase family protein [Amedibacillus dolichus]MCB5372182.1 O-antigen ligase family protein [Amedibacillus dolichus]
MNKKKFAIQLNTILASLLLMSRLIIIIFYSGYDFYYITPVLYSLIASLFIIVTLLNKKISKYSCILLMIVSTYYFVGILNGVTDLSILDIIIYCFIPVFAMSKEINTKMLLRIIMFFSLLSIPVIEKLFVFQYISLQQVDMSVTYAFLFCIISACLHFIYFRSSKNILDYICYIFNVYLLIKILSVGNRGAYLVIVVFILLMQILYIKNKEIKKNKRRMVWLLLLIESVFLIYFALNIDTIILNLFDILSKNGINVPSFIIKMRRQIIGNDISNGRNDVYSFFINSILVNPIGYGISSSNAISNGLYAYPHNFILQFSFEFGLIGIFFSFFVVYPIYLLIKKQNMIEKNFKILIVFLLINTVPKCLISGDIWEQSQLWMMLSIGIMLFKKKERIYDK